MSRLAGALEQFPVMKNQSLGISILVMRPCVDHLVTIDWGTFTCGRFCARAIGGGSGLAIKTGEAKEKHQDDACLSELVLQTQIQWSNQSDQKHPARQQHKS